jgi:hypothetical protein
MNGVLTYLNAPFNAVPGDIVLTGGNNQGTDTLNSGLAQLNNFRASQIADTANVKLRAGAQWLLNGFNETIGSLTFEGQGGSFNGVGSNIQMGSGTLTIAAGGAIAATALDDPRVMPLVLGNLSLPSSLTLTVEKVRGTDVTGPNGLLNSQVGLALNSTLVSPSTITKAGNGVLSLGGASFVSNTVIANAGALVLGPNSNYGLTQIRLGTGTVLDMRGQTNLQVGSIVDALRHAYDAPRGVDQVAVDFAQAYNADAVWEAHWKPVMKGLAEWCRASSSPS